MRNFVKNLAIDLLLISISSILAGCAYFMLYIIVNLIMGNAIWTAVLYFVLIFINILVPLLIVSFKHKINIVNRRYKKEKGKSFRVFLLEENSTIIALFIVFLINILFENSKLSLIYFSLFALNQYELSNFMGDSLSAILVLVVYYTYSFIILKRMHSFPNNLSII